MNEQTGLSVQCNIILNIGYMCGIPAIGRCATCQRAFCTSHQARSSDVWGYPIAVNGMCAPCLEAKRVAEIQLQKEEYAPEAFFEDGEARKLMQESGKQRVKMYYAAEKSKSGFFGMRTWTEYTFVCYGWVIGTFFWLDIRATDYAYALHSSGGRVEQDDSGDYSTVLVDTDKYNTYFLDHCRENHGMAPVRRYADGYAYTPSRGTGGRWLLKNIEQAGQAVREFRYKDKGPLTQETLLHDPDALCGYHDGKVMTVGNAMMVRPGTVLFNPLTSFEWYELPLANMVELEEVREPGPMETK